jgi:hypothetical protein
MRLYKGNLPVWKAPKIRGNLSGVRFPCFAETKYDGEFEFVVVEETDSYTVNKYGTERRDFPALNRIVTELYSHNISRIVLLAELYAGDGKSGSLPELLKDKTSDILTLRVFDYIGDTPAPLYQRKLWLQTVLPEDCLIIPRLIPDRELVKQCFTNTIQSGYEGIVIKNYNSLLRLGVCSWVKMKETDETDFPVHFISDDEERIEIKTDTGIVVGVKVVERVKSTLTVGDIVTVKYNGLMPSGSLRHPVFVRKVV